MGSVILSNRRSYKNLNVKTNKHTTPPSLKGRWGIKIIFFILFLFYTFKLTFIIIKTKGDDFMNPEEEVKIPLKDEEGNVIEENHYPDEDEE